MSNRGLERAPNRTATNERLDTMATRYEVNIAKLATTASDKRAGHFEHFARVNLGDCSFNESVARSRFEEFRDRFNGPDWHLTLTLWSEGGRTIAETSPR